MKDSTKKWLIVAGGVVICGVLVAVIASRFARETVTDASLPPSSSQQGGVIVDPDDGATPSPEPEEDREQENDVTVRPETPDAGDTATGGNGADASGTEQTIQADPVKPEEPDESILTDPTRKPDGTPVEGTPQPEDHDSVTPPSPSPSTNTSGGLPGFENVPDAGENQVTEGVSDGDINKQVGIMG